MDVWGRYKTLGGACCVVALALLLAGCGSRPLEADADTQTPAPTPQVATAPEPEATPTGDIAALAAPFEGVHAGATVEVKERKSFFEVKISAADLDVNTEPDNWPAICESLVQAVTESQAISDSNFEGKPIAAKLIDGAGENLCNISNGAVKYDAYNINTDAESVTSNDPRITLHEYNRIAVGMTYTECVEIIGGDGVRDLEIGDAGGIGGLHFTCEWQGTSDSHSVARLSFDDYILTSKFEIGLE